MINKIYREVTSIRKELQAIRKYLEFGFSKENRAENVSQGVYQAVLSAIHGTNTECGKCAERKDECEKTI